MTDRPIRIGGASGFWGDAARATPQLLAVDGLDYLIYDYLAEITMSILARARVKDPDKGYATDFVSAAMVPHLGEIAARGVKVIANAGGVNPAACGAALEAAIAKQGLDLTVACVTGDDLLARRDEFAGAAVTEMFSGAAFPPPEKILSINAYLGAFPIARALALGADIVITGRCVDSAVTLAACIHAFGWAQDDFDRLAQGALAGHILECGVQATGGNFTDWEQVPDLANLGYPVAEIDHDGSFVVTKPAGSGGLVTVGTVAEQMLYEIGDPRAYVLPDVICDFSTATLEQQGADRVRVSGATGRPAPAQFKVSATFADQFRGGTYLTFYGLDADRKARAFADAAFAAARSRLQGYGLPDFSETDVELLGTESQYGAFSEVARSREVVLKLAAKHPDMAGIGILLKEAVGLGLATPPGLSGFAGTRPAPSPVVRLFSFTVPRASVPATITIDGLEHPCAETPGEAPAPAPPPHPAPDLPAPAGKLTAVPLVRLAFGRSGDKGDKANIGIIARRPEYLPWIWRSLSVEVVTARFAHFLGAGAESRPAAAREPGKTTRVERFLLPGSHAMNVLLHDVLGGGGVASLRNDPQGKGYAQLLLSVPVDVPAELAAGLDGELAAGRPAGIAAGLAANLAESLP